MSPELQQQVRKVYERAIEMPQRERQSYLRSACAGQPEVLAEVMRLLDAHDNRGTFFENGADDVRTTQSPRIGRYIIRRRLGAGGMGVVYEAMDPDIGRIIALKTIDVKNSGEDSELRGRLLREARSAGALSHPGIVTIYDVGTAAGNPFIAMELVDGQTIQDFLETGALFPIPRTMDILRQSAAALDFAHARQILHRDIKPGNVMLRKDGAVKITDFGIAKMMAPGITTMHTHGFIGTLYYMSPEQFRGADVDGRSDQFSLAVMAYRLLSGHLPFTGDGAMLAIVNGPRPSIRTANPALPAALDGPLHRALAIDAADRFPTCAAFVETLERSAGLARTDDSDRTTRAGGQTDNLKPPPEPVPQPPRRWTAAIVAAVLSILALAGGGLYYRSHLSPPPATSNLPPAIVRFSAEPRIVKPGEPVTLRWDVSDAARVVIDQGVGKVPGEGSVELRPSSTTRYTLTASGAGAERSAAVVVEIRAATNPGPDVTPPVVAPSRTPPVASAPLVSKVPEKPDPARLYNQAIEQRQTDPARAAAQLQRAADLGEPRAMLELGKMFWAGQGVKASPSEAGRWFRKASESGNPAAMVLLGAMYSEGKGVDKDDREAARWFRQAADAGDKRGMDNLGDLYLSGRGVPMDPAEAVRWHKKAAAGGSATAMYHLGNIYEQGSAGPRNVPEAKKLYSDAAALGHEEARARLTQLQNIPDPPTLTLTGIQPPYIAEGEMRQYKVLGSGFTLHSTVRLDVPGFVASRQDRRIPDYRPAEAASDGTWMKIFIYIERQPTGKPVRISAQTPGSNEASINVPLRR